MALARQIANEIIGPMVAAGGVVLILLWLDGAYGDLVEIFLWPLWNALVPRGVAVSLEQAVPNWFGRGPGYAAMMTENAAALVVTGAQVTGVFLGLYFTAVSVVASTAYSNAPANLRAVVLDDPVGNLYLRVVGFTAAACVFALGASAFGFVPGPLTTATLVVLTAASVLSFIRLGNGVFEFFSPAAVTRALSRDIAKAVNGAAASTYLARDPSIQAHYRRIASGKLDAWEELAVAAVSSPQNASALREVGRGATRLLSWYGTAKRSIPNQSFWFERTLRHESYFTASSSSLDLGLKTGGMLPTEAPDPLWLERRLQSLVERVTRSLAEHGHLRPTLDLFASLNEWVATAARHHEPKQMRLAFGTSERLREVVHSAVTRDGEDAEAKLYRLAVVDAVVQGLPVAIAAFIQRLGTLDTATVLEGAVLAAQGGPVPDTFPPRLRANLEFFRKAHSFERDVEGEVNTPPWFIRHHNARLFTLDIRETFEELLVTAEGQLAAHVSSLRALGRVEEAATVIERGLESVAKLAAGRSKIVVLLRSLEASRVHAAGSEWPDVDLDGWEQRIRRLRRTLVHQLASVAIELPTDVPTGEVPDAFGFAYTTLSSAAIDALLDLDEDLFQAIYPTLVRTAPAAHERVRGELAESPIESALLYSADVMLDLLDISGYAYLCGALLGRSFWETVVRTWEHFLSGFPDPSRLIRLILAEDDFHGSQFTISPRSVVRTQWRFQVRDELIQQGFQPGGAFQRSTPSSIAVDPLAAAYLDVMESATNARDLFVSEYLLRRTEAQSLDVPAGVERLRQAAKRRKAARAEGRPEGLVPRSWQW